MLYTVTDYNKFYASPKVSISDRADIRILTTVDHNGSEENTEVGEYWSLFTYLQQQEKTFPLPNFLFTKKVSVACKYKIELASPPQF